MGKGSEVGYSNANYYLSLVLFENTAKESSREMIYLEDFLDKQKFDFKVKLSFV